MREVRSWGKDGSVTMFLTARCGSAVMRQMLRDGEELREWGMLIFPGFKRFLSTTCFLVVRTSQTASLWSGASSSSSSLSPIRVFLVAFFSFSSCFDLMCRRSADEALVTYIEKRKELRNWNSCWKIPTWKIFTTHLVLVKLVRRTRGHLGSELSWRHLEGRIAVQVKSSTGSIFCDNEIRKNPRKAVSDCPALACISHYTSIQWRADPIGI